MQSGAGFATASVNARAQIEASRLALQDRNLVRDPFIDEALKQDPDLYTQSTEKVKSTLDDWRAGRIPSLTEALREQLDLGALPEPGFSALQLACPHLDIDAAASTSFGRYPGQPPQSLATVTELGLPLHRDPSDDMLDQDSSPPLGIMPVFHRGMIRAAMRPAKARVLSRPGRGPMPLPISVHPQARPFGVAQSSLALREAAHLRAKDPTARQLVSRRHAPPRLEPPPKPEPCLPEGFEMPEKLPSPETAVTLLAQANRAHQRYLNLAKQPQNASQFAPPAVLGADAATAGTAGDFIKDYPLINPRAKASPAAAPQAIAATAASAAAPTAAPSLPTMGAQRLAVDQQPVSSSAQALPQAAPLAAAAPTATLPAGLAIPLADATDVSSSAAQPHAASTAEEAAAGTADSVDDESAELQLGKAIKQRPGQKQRKRQREIAELKKVEDAAKAVAEAEANRKAEADAKAKQEAEAKAKAAEKEAKAAEAAAKAEAEKAEEAMAEEAAAARQKAEAASLKAAAELLASEEAAVQGKKSDFNICSYNHVLTAQHDCWSGVGL